MSSSTSSSPLMENSGIMSKVPVHKKARSPKPSARSKRASVHEHGVTGLMDGRHKRVWKACERCRMKKTKCDGESPCKRCKDDGLVCTAGSRKKTEFKQLPKGYAEVLEHTQYALIGTVQKLYAMVRAGESWTFEEPALNDRGLPVIHNIAEILGCIRQAPDLPYVFPENEEGFQELERKLASSDFNSPPNIPLKPELNGRKLSDDSAVDMQDTKDIQQDTPHIDTASSSETDHEEPSEADYNNMLWAQSQIHQRLPSAPYSTESLMDISQAPSSQSLMATAPTPFTSHRHSASAFSFASMDNISPVYSNISSPVLRTDSPFKTTWYSSAANAGSDDFLGTTHPLDITASYVQRQTQLRREQRYSDSFLQAPMIPRPEAMMGDGTIRPGMLDCRGGVTQGMDGLGFDCDVSNMWE